MRLEKARGNKQSAEFMELLYFVGRFLVRGEASLGGRVRSGGNSKRLLRKFGEVVVEIRKLTCGNLFRLLWKFEQNLLKFI